LAKQEPLANHEGISVLNLLTREAADEEKRILEKEVQEWKKIAEDRAVTIKTLETTGTLDCMFCRSLLRILGLTERELRRDLKAEVERSTSLASKNARKQGSTAHQTSGRGDDDPKRLEVLKFYEDVTNVLVTHVKIAPSNFLDLEEWHLTCVFTFEQPPYTQDSIKQSKCGHQNTFVTVIYRYSLGLNFNLRFCYEMAPHETEPIQSIDQLKKSVRFTPVGLEHEPEDFRKALGYLAKPFTFERTQLPLFIRSLYEAVEKAVTGEEEEEEEAEVDVEE
jgi:hypothetical protein